MTDTVNRDSTPTEREAFDEGAWNKQLYKLNPYARKLDARDDDDEFLSKRNEATIARHSQGVDAWNAWANAMLALRRTLEETGNWDAVHEGGATGRWVALATARFGTKTAKHTFEHKASFVRFIFPAAAVFEGSTFPGGALFNLAVFFGHANFKRAIFTLDTRFEKAQFLSLASFDDTTFSDEVFFRSATFSNAAFAATTFTKDVHFDSATWSGTVWFGGLTFSGSAWFLFAKFGETATFSNVTFCGDAVFLEAVFSGDADFKSATFEGRTNFERAHFAKDAKLSQATFEGSTTLEGGIFENGADFEGVDSQGYISFADTTFKQVPSLIGARFRGTLRLDHLQTPRFPWFGWTTDKNAPARFRDLKRRAAESHDQDRELEFFAQEIRTSRFHAKGISRWVPRAWEWRFWFGLLYGTFSNFGRSFLRPALFWVVLLVGFAIFFLGEHDGMRSARSARQPEGLFSSIAAYAITTRDAWRSPPQCKPLGSFQFPSTNALTEAFHLSFRNAIVFDPSRADAFRRTYGCLFGFETIGGQENPRVTPRVSLVPPLRVWPVQC